MMLLPGAIHVTSLSRRRNTKIDIFKPPVASSNVCIPRDFSHLSLKMELV